MSLLVRPFAPDEAGVLKAIRLEALADSPADFAERHDVALAMGGEDFSKPLAAGRVWGVFEGGRCIGMAGLDRFIGTNVAHKAIIWGVYVAPQARGTGAAEALFRAIIDHARSIGIELLELGVNEASAPARRFYARMGFEPFGLQRGSLKLGDRYFDDVLMMLRL